MKILIADDERLIRVDLEAIINELFPDMHTINQAKDGQELIEMIRHGEYDVVFVDIDMPKISGLEAIKVCEEMNLKTKWYILTGYADFQYAKQAISLGVCDYLLKPIEEEKVKLVLEEVQKELADKKNEQHHIFESSIIQSFLLADSLGEINDLQVKKRDASYYLYIFFVDTGSYEQQQAVYADIFNELQRELNREYLKENDYALFFLNSGELYLLMEGKKELRIDVFFNQYSKTPDRKAKLTIFWSKKPSFKEIYSDKQMILALSPNRFLKPNRVVLCLRDLEQDTLLMKKRFFCGKIEILTAGFAAKDYEKVHDVLLEIEKDEKLFDLLTGKEAECFSQFLSIVFDREVTVTSEDQFFNFLQNVLEEMLADQKYDLIESIRKYVKNNYMNDVTIAALGAQFQITPSYISRLFREKTGQKYIDYVTEVRMEKAKELLQVNLSIKEVAERVGYISEKYFSKIFFKYYSITPSQFKR